MNPETKRKGVCGGMRWVTLVDFLSPRCPIALDYDAVDALGVRFKGAVDLEGSQG